MLVVMHHVVFTCIYIELIFLFLPIQTTGFFIILRLYCIYPVCALCTHVCHIHCIGNIACGE